MYEDYTRSKLARLIKESCNEQGGKTFCSCVLCSTLDPGSLSTRVLRGLGRDALQTIALHNGVNSDLVLGQIKPKVGATYTL